MAQIILSFGAGGAPSRAGGVAQVFDAYPETQELTSGGTSQQSTITAKSNSVARVKNTDASQIAWVIFGANPTAIAGSGHCLAPGETLDVGPVGEGHKMAVINDS